MSTSSDEGTIALQNMMTKPAHNVKDQHPKVLDSEQKWICREEGSGQSKSCLCSLWPEAKCDGHSAGHETTGTPGTQNTEAGEPWL